MADGIKINWNKDALSQIKKMADKAVREKCRIIVRRRRKLLSRKSVFEVVDAENLNLTAGTIINDLDDATFKRGEIFGGDPEVRRLRIGLKRTKPPSTKRK